MHTPWTKAIDIEGWADRVEARSELPRLIRRLIWATTKGQRKFSFPAGEGVQRPGWDGQLSVEQGNAWAPDGESRWEISVGDPPTDKANENYKKRTAATSAKDAAATTFIFVTARKWTGKDQWVKEKTKEGIWKKVVVFDSDDLEQWLEVAPAVDIWFARQLGKIPLGVSDLSHYWDSIFGISKPPIPSTAFLAGRNNTKDELLETFNAGPHEVKVAAVSVREVVDFIAAAFGSGDDAESITSRLVVVETKEAWNHIECSTEPLILIPSLGVSVDGAEVGRAIGRGHHVVTRRPYSIHAEDGVIRLPRAWRFDLAQALKAGGFDEASADRLARESGGSLTSLQRLIAPNGGNVGPTWTQDPDALRLLPLVLIGGWDDSNPTDREFVSALTHDSFENVMAFASGLLTHPDCPLRRTGTQWQFISREDAWLFLALRLTRPQLESFAAVALNALRDDDPRFDLKPEERLYAPLRGQVPKYSNLLKGGVAETLALLGADIANMPSLQPKFGEGLARSVVRELLKGDISGRVWYALAPRLRLVAEAAPDEFLAALEHDLGLPNPGILGLFGADEHSLFGGSLHYHLMWTLTALAWDPSYLARVALILADLSRIDPGVKSHPKPDSSLVEIFRLWHPQTAATTAQRFEVIDLLIEQRPGEAWTLLFELLPETHESATPTMPPRWRQWSSLKALPPLTRKEVWEQTQWTAARLVKLAKLDGNRLIALARAIDRLPDPSFGEFCEYLRTLDPQTLPPEQRIELWNTVRQMVRHHEFFPDATWRMHEDRLKIVRLVETHWLPTDPAGRGRWLFGGFHHDFGTYQETSFEEQERLTFEAQKGILNELLSGPGISAVVEFSKLVSYPGMVGHVLGASGLIGEPGAIVPKYLDDKDESVRLFATGFVGAAFFIRGWAWVDGLPLAEWSKIAASGFLAALPFDPRTWQWAEKLGSEVDAEYWKKARPMPRELSESDCAIAVRQLINHNRILEAIDFTGLVFHNKKALPSELLTEMLEKGVEAINSTRERTDMSMIAYHIGEVMKKLQAAPDADPGRIAHLELRYIRMARDNTWQPKFLHDELAKNPDFFANCVATIFRPDVAVDTPGEQPKMNPDAAAVVYQLLESWGPHPALTKEGGLNADEFRIWVEQARAACAKLGRVKSGDDAIGKLLADGPAEADGSWPCIAVRGVLEKVPGEEILSAFVVGVLNGRGVTTKSLHEGGRQEQALAEKYERFANSCQMRWPRTAKALRQIAKSYAHDASHWDESADQDA